MISDEERTRRLAAALHEEWRTGTLKCWYVSFSGDGGWKGAVLVRAYGQADACKTAWDLGINPGGSALAFPKKDEIPDPPPEAMNRLLNREEVEQYCGPVKVVHR